MSKKYHVNERSFLNDFTDMPGCIIAIIQDTREIPFENENEWKWAERSLSISDCVRRITIEFDMSTEEERHNSIAKIAKIAEVANAVLEALQLEAALMSERQSIVPVAKTATNIH